MRVTKPRSVLVHRSITKYQVLWCGKGTLEGTRTHGRTRKPSRQASIVAVVKRHGTTLAAGTRTRYLI